MTDWLRIVNAPPEIGEALCRGLLDSSSETLEELVREHEASLTVAFVSPGDDLTELSRLTAEAASHVVAVTPQLDAVVFRRLFGHGVVGIVAASAAAGQLADACRAAIRGDVLLPAALLRELTLGNVGAMVEEADMGPVTRAVLDELAAGKSIKEIASTLNYSERTVHRRVRNICLLFGAMTPAQAVHLAHERGIL